MERRYLTFTALLLEDNNSTSTINNDYLRFQKTYFNSEHLDKRSLSEGSVKKKDDFRFQKPYLI